MLQKGDALIDISESTTVSTAVETNGLIPVGIIMPALWTAADITFQASWNGVDFHLAVDDTGAPITLTAPAANEFVVIETRLIVRYLKLVAGNAQAADRTLQVLLEIPV